MSMLPHCTGCAGLVVLLLCRTGLADEVSVQAAAPPAHPKPPVVLGLMADAGVPDGANAALVLSPTEWLRFHMGGGTNTVSAGYRGGLTLVPFGVGPSFSMELGHYRDGDANGLVRRFAGTNHWLTPLFERIGYTYVNWQLGLELGHGPVQFFVHGGLSYVHAVIHNANAALQKGTAGEMIDASTTVTVTQDPVVRVLAPSLKLGMVVYLGGER